MLLRPIFRLAFCSHKVYAFISRVCLCVCWKRRAVFHFFFFSSHEGALSNMIQFKFLTSRHPGRCETSDANQVTTLSLLFIIYRCFAGAFSLSLAPVTLALSWCFFGHSLQAPSLFPPPLSHTGSLLLAVHFYSSLRAAPVIPSTALGILLLILSSLLAYAGKTRKAASFWASPSIALHVFGLLCQRVCTNCGSLARPLTSPAWGIYQHTTFFLYKQPKK